MQQQNQPLPHSNSNVRLQELKKEEEQVAKLLDVQHFYHDQHLDLNQLKNRLLKIKNRSRDINVKSIQEISPKQEKGQETAFFPSQLHDEISEEQNHLNLVTVQQKPSSKPIRQRVIYQNHVSHNLKPIKNKNENYSSFLEDKINEQELANISYNPQVKNNKVKAINYKILKEVKQKSKNATSQSKYRSPITLAPLPRGNDRYQPSIKHFRIQSRIYKRRQKSRNSRSRSKNSETSRLKSLESQQGNPFQNKIVIATPEQLYQFQKRVQDLWILYQLLTHIMMGVTENAEKEKNSIIKYIEDVCSSKFQFIRGFLSLMASNNNQSASRVKVNSMAHKGAIEQNMSRIRVDSFQKFHKRLGRVVLISKLLQNLSVVYLSLQLSNKKKITDPNLTNFMGYGTSNIIFLIKLMKISHKIMDFDEISQSDNSQGVPLQFSSTTIRIFEVIKQFQMDSYKQQINKVRDIAIRMEHNNQILGIIQSKLCSKMGKDFQHIVNSFLKNVDRDDKIFLEYSHYIYDYLAFYLHQNNRVGNFSSIEISPSPYLNPPCKKTVIIEPWEVLFCQKTNKQMIYVRANAELFLDELSKICNVILWSQLMPSEVDQCLQSFPKKENIFRLYRYHCKFENDNFIKLLSRVGCDIDNTIIIDNCQSHFKYDRSAGMQFCWKGQKKDNKLVMLLNMLEPLLLSQTPLRKALGFIRRQIQLLKKNQPQKKILKKRKNIMDMKSYNNQYLIKRFNQKGNKAGQESDFPRKLNRKIIEDTEYEYL